MQVVFRADASLQMGSGHVMRCLTLADALGAQGAQCSFISRAHPGHLMALIQQRGYVVHCLAEPVQKAPAARNSMTTTVQGAPSNPQQGPAHAAWLGTPWQADAQDTAAVLASLQPDWLVVDHYALDQRWEEAQAAHCRRLLVIDDLADRPHRCDLLLDQNLGRQPQDYAALVPAHCEVLTGPRYALLRPEFSALRRYSLQRRQAQPGLRQLLISMGGVDQFNATGQVMQALKSCALPQECRISVVMGLTAPWLENVRQLAAQMPWPTEVVVNVTDMAQRMADSDLAIGAAGSTSWERCCLGLPTLMVVLAANQRRIASALALKGAAIALEISNYERFAAHLTDVVLHLVSNQDAFCKRGVVAARVTDGRGTNVVVTHLLGKLVL